MKALIKAILIALGWLEETPPPAPMVLRVAKPEPWTAEHAKEFAEFLLGDTGRVLCARARWIHLNAASLAVQAPGNAAAMDAARGTAETLRFLHELSGLTHLPDLSPDQDAGNDADESETTPSLHSLLTHAPDAD